MYPNMNTDEVCKWINSVYRNNGVKKMVKSYDDLNNLFDYLISYSGLLFWRSKVNDPVFQKINDITISGTHSYGEVVNELNVWTTVDENWINKHVIKDADPNIRDRVKAMLE